MARDRQRAKQRRDRNRRAGNDRAPARPLDPDTEAPLEQDDPLAHGSADVDLAHLQVALGRPELEEQAEDMGEDYVPGDDELDADADAAAGGGGRHGFRNDRGGGEDDGGDDHEPSPAGLPVERPAPSGNRVFAFVQASWRELQRVQWPDRKQVAQATGVVLGFVIIAGAYLGLADAVAQKIIKIIL